MLSQWIKNRQVETCRFLAGAEGLDDPQSQLRWLDVLLRSTAWVELPTTLTTTKKAALGDFFVLAGAEGLEPTTHGFGDQYSTN